MKKYQGLLIATTLLGSLVLAPLSADAAVAGSANSRATVDFSSGSGGVGVTDPDPEHPSEPITPPEGGGETGGSADGLSLDYVTNMNFGEQEISLIDKTYNVIPFAQYYNQVQELNKEKGPHFVQVSDRRGTQAGWHLTVKQDQQFKAGTNELAGAELRFSNGQTVTDFDRTNVTSVSSLVLTPGAGESKVMTAASGAQNGIYKTTWGTVKIDETGKALSSTAEESVKLFVPKNANAKAAVYSTVLTWTLNDVPN